MEVNLGSEQYPLIKSMMTMAYKVIPSVIHRLNYKL